jgi:hypothetical protein
MELRIKGGGELFVRANDVERLPRNASCSNGPLFGPTEAGFKIVDRSIRYVSTRPQCASHSGNERFWSCRNRDEVAAGVRILE